MLTSLPPTQLGAAQTSAVTLALALLALCAGPLLLLWLVDLALIALTAPRATPATLAASDAPGVPLPPPLQADRALIETLPALPALPALPTAPSAPSAFPLYTPPVVPPVVGPVGSSLAVLDQRSPSLPPFVGDDAHDGAQSEPESGWPPAPRVPGATPYQYIFILGQLVRVSGLRSFSAQPLARSSLN